MVGINMHVFNAGPTAGEKHQRECEKLIRFILWIGAVIKPFYLSLTIISPELPTFPSSVSAPMTTTVRVAWVLPMMYVICTVWSNMLFLATYLMAYVYSTLDMLDVLK